MKSFCSSCPLTLKTTASGGCTFLFVPGTQKNFALPTRQPCAENWACRASKSTVAFSRCGSFILWHLRWSSICAWTPDAAAVRARARTTACFMRYTSGRSDTRVPLVMSTRKLDRREIAQARQDSGLGLEDEAGAGGGDEEGVEARVPR